MLLFELNELSALFILRIYSVFILEYSNRICPFLYIYLWPYATENARMKKIEFWENKLIFGFLEEMLQLIFYLFLNNFLLVIYFVELLLISFSFFLFIFLHRVYLEKYITYKAKQSGIKKIKKSKIPKHKRYKSLFVHLLCLTLKSLNDPSGRKIAYLQILFKCSIYN